MSTNDELKEEEKKPILSPLPSPESRQNSEAEGQSQSRYEPCEDLNQMTNLLSLDDINDPTEIAQVTRLDAFFLLANAMIGAGVLVQSEVMQDSGLIAGSILFILVAIITFMGVRLLTNLADASGEKEYGEIAFKAFGPIGSLAVDLSVVVFNFSTVTSYIMYLGSLSSDIIHSYYEYNFEWYTSSSFYSAVLTLGIVLPICLVRNFANLTIVAYFSIIMMVMVALVVIIDGSVVQSAEWSSLTLFSLSGSAMQLCNLVYSLGFAPTVLFVYTALKSKHKKSMTAVNLSAVMFGTILCLTIGITGYVLFGEGTSSNVISNLRGAAKRVCDVGMIAHFALFLPGDFFIMRASLYHLTQFGQTGRYTSADERPPLRTIQDLDDLIYFVYTATALIAILVFVVLIDFYGGGMNGETYQNINSILGGLAGSLDTFIIPGACGLVYFSPKSSRYNESVILILAGLVCMVVILIGAGLTIDTYNR